MQAFLGSSWQTTDFIKAVEPTGDLRRVFDRLLREPSGESFLARLRDDVSRLPAQERKRMEAAISQALNGHG